jgi:hypothetical protein
MDDSLNKQGNENRTKKKWNNPILFTLDIRKTQGGENSTWNEDTFGVGYVELPPS